MRRAPRRAGGCRRDSRGRSRKGGEFAARRHHHRHTAAGRYRWLRTLRAPEGCRPNQLDSGHCGDRLGAGWTPRTRTSRWLRCGAGQALRANNAARGNLPSAAPSSAGRGIRPRLTRHQDAVWPLPTSAKRLTPGRTTHPRSSFESTPGLACSPGGVTGRDNSLHGLGAWLWQRAAVATGPGVGPLTRCPSSRAVGRRESRGPRSRRRARRSGRPRLRRRRS